MAMIQTNRRVMLNIINQEEKEEFYKGSTIYRVNIPRVAIFQKFYHVLIINSFIFFMLVLFFSLKASYIVPLYFMLPATIVWAFLIIDIKNPWKNCGYKVFTLYIINFLIFSADILIATALAFFVWQTMY